MPIKKSKGNEIVGRGSDDDDVECEKNVVSTNFAFVLVALAALMLRGAVGIHPYSGTIPMFFLTTWFYQNIHIK